VQDAQHNLAIILNQEHQYAEAETLFSQLIATRIRVFGAENRATLFGRQALASNLNAQKRYREAAVEAKAALDGLMRLLGENNESVHQGDAASRSEAEPILLSSVASLEKSSGSANNRTRSAYLALSELYTALGRADEAAQWKSKLLPDKP